MITITEKLILANAVKIFGSDAHKIRLYIVSRSPGFNIEKWEDIYKDILAEAEKFGYSNPIEYCEDIRYLKMLEIYESKKVILSGLKPEAIEEFKDHVSMKEINLDNSTKKNIKSFYLYENTIPYVYIKKNDQEELELDSKKSSNLKDATNDGDSCFKNTGNISRRLLYRLSDKEKAFENCFSAVETKSYFGDISCNIPKNYLASRFPRTSKKKNEASESETPTKRPKKLEDHYNSVIKKLLHNKKSSKDKIAWPGEYKIMVKYLLKIVRENSDIHTDLIEELQKILAEKQETYIQNAVVKVMVILQKMIFEIDDPDWIKDLNSIKFKFSLLCDFYKR